MIWVPFSGRVAAGRPPHGLGDVGDDLVSKKPDRARGKDAAGNRHIYFVNAGYCPTKTTN